LLHTSVPPAKFCEPCLTPLSTSGLIEIVAIACPPKVGLVTAQLPRRRTGYVLVSGFAPKILKWRLPSGRALARRFNFSQASLCNAFLSILEVFSRYGNSHGPGAGTHTFAGPRLLGRVSGNLPES